MSSLTIIAYNSPRGWRGSQPVKRITIVSRDSLKPKNGASLPSHPSEHWFFPRATDFLLASREHLPPLKNESYNHKSLRCYSRQHISTEYKAPPSSASQRQSRSAVCREQPWKEEGRRGLQWSALSQTGDTPNTVRITKQGKKQNKAVSRKSIKKEINNTEKTHTHTIV